MATTITKPISRLIWYAADLPLANAPFLPNVNVIRVVNPAGSGFNSFKPGGLNSYTIAKAGDIIEVVAKNIPSGGFLIDNGIPPVTNRIKVNFPASNTSAADVLIGAGEGGTYMLNTTTGAGITVLSVNAVTYKRNGAMLTGATVLADGDNLTIGGTTDNTPGTITLVKQ